jgi:hypothetical protein
MNRLVLLLAPSLALAACADDAGEQPADDAAVPAEVGASETVGAAPDAGAVLPAADVIARADELNGQTIRVEGEVAEVCQMAGCWLTFQNEAGVSFRVAVPRNDDGGYAFTFPRDAAGSRVLVQGTLDVTETDVATRQHLAEDAGATPEEVAAITEPERTVVLNATGARVERAVEEEAG